MIKRPNPYANISLAPPEILKADFQPPAPMQIAAPQMEAPDTGGQVEGLGNSLLALRKRFGNQGAQLKGALQGGAAGKA